MSWMPDPADDVTAVDPATGEPDDVETAAVAREGDLVADAPVDGEIQVVEVVTVDIVEISEGEPETEVEAEAEREAEAEAEPAEAEPVIPAEPDERLLAAHDLALAALREVTSDHTVGAPAGYTLEDRGVVSLRFENRLAGYPGWFWTVSVAVVDDADPTVLELELLPGDDALLAPEWVPWAVRLADYQAAQVAAAGAGGDVEESDDEELDEIEDLDAADFDDDGSSILHAGDVDGVDIDELADLPASEDDGEGFEDDSDDDDADDEDSDDEDSDDEYGDADEDDEDDDLESDEDESDEDESDEDEDESDEDEDDSDEDES